MIRLFAVSLFLMVLGHAVYGQQRSLRLSVRDADTGDPLAARVYLTSSQGDPYYFAPATASGSADRYEKKNWINSSSVEYHTTVSAHPCIARVPAGNYLLIVERGKTYRGHQETIQVGSEDVERIVRLRRWVDPATRGWYSGDTHIHRTLKELRTVQLAEDLNVTFPLTNWVTRSDTLPAAGAKSEKQELPDGLVTLDATHVIWPRNTEYEIFTVGGQRHTLGALFVLAHQDSLQQTVPPWRGVVAANRSADPQPLYDMDKLDWPFAMLLPTIVPNALYELSNNHTWRTEFAFRKWNTRAAAYLQPPFGAGEGGHRAWLDYTHGMYYTLLNCGFRLPPSAGTANGVHPVPAGFGRVYVHQEGGFEFGGWLEGLRQGRSFVTTGPMVFAQAAGKLPGHVFQSADGELSLSIEAEILSEQPLAYGELLVQGEPIKLLRSSPTRDERGAYRTLIKTSVQADRSGWFALRFWQFHEDGRTRFAHTAPWYVEIDGPVKPQVFEKQYLIDRMREEIARSEPFVSSSALKEYQQALAFYESLPTRDDGPQVAAEARPEQDPQRREAWLENMVVHHRFTPHEVRLAMGLAAEEAAAEVAARAEQGVAKESPANVRVLPYPGGRHPRRGFLDGAIQPQRDTKISIFPPWKDGGYVVVDVPEAIFSNLGLTYLAHTHIPTIWDEQGVTLPPVEWQKTTNGWKSRRELPNNIVFETHVVPRDDEVLMEIELANGTEQELQGLRVQVCTMLKGAVGFSLQEPLQQVTEGSMIAVRAHESDRWIVTSWTPNHRTWDNPPVPCFHSDPIFPDCAPGETVSVRGRLFFYEGEDVQAAMARREW